MWGVMVLLSRCQYAQGVTEMDPRPQEPGAVVRGFNSSRGLWSYSGLQKRKSPASIWAVTGCGLPDRTITLGSLDKRQLYHETQGYDLKPKVLLSHTPTEFLRSQSVFP